MQKIDDPEVINVLKLHFETSDLKEKHFEMYEYFKKQIETFHEVNLRRKNEIKTVNNQIKLF